MARFLKPEIVFITKGEMLSSSVLERLKEHSGKMVLWYPDSYLPDDPIYGREIPRFALPIYDLVLVGMRGRVRPLSKYNTECHFAPAYFDNHFFAPAELTPEDWAQFGCDATFIGNYSAVHGPERVRQLKVAAQVCNVKIWGAGWWLRLPNV